MAIPDVEGADLHIGDAGLVRVRVVDVQHYDSKQVIVQPIDRDGDVSTGTFTLPSRFVKKVGDGE